MSFEPLKPKEYKYVDAPIKTEPDWQKLYMNSVEQTMSLAGAFGDILKHPERIEPYGKEISGYLALIQENLSAQMMHIGIERSKK